MLKGKGFLFCASVAFSCAFAAAATTITPVQPTLKKGCYEISSAAELYGFAAIVQGSDGFAKDSSACGKLTKDIVVNENVLDENGELNAADTADFVKWTPIGTFYGTFDGQMHTVSGLYYSDESRDGAGLFRNVNSSDDLPKGTEISNVGVVGSFFRTGYSAGGIVGYIYAQGGSVSIKNCFNASRVEATKYNAGGIVGSTSNYGKVPIRLYNVYNTGTIVGPNYVGGLIGSGGANGIALINAYNTGEIIGTTSTNFMKSLFGSYTKDPDNVIENAFYLEPGRNEHFGKSVTADELASGIVTQVMRDYDMDGLDASVWGQDVGTDPLPVFGKEFTGTDYPTIKMSLYHGETLLKTKDIVVGYSYRIPNVDVEGYDFFGWKANENLSGDTVVHAPATLTEDVSYWGRYEKRYNVALETNSGTVDSGLVESYTHSVATVLPRKVSRSGYVFVGWYDNEEFAGDRVKAIDADATGDKTFYARWYKMETPEKDEDGCYVIKTAPELYGFAAIVNGTDGYTKEKEACAGLANDIVVNENVLKANGTLDSANAGQFIPWNPIDSFAGVFNGNMHEVSGLFFDDTTFFRYDFGFFGSVAGTSAKYGELKNFGLVDSYIAAKTSYFGAIVGATVRAELGNRTAPPASYVKMSGVYNKSTLYSYARPQGIAGIVGSVGYKGILDIENCYNVGRVMGKNVTAAGIIGHSMADVVISVSNCYNVWPTKDGMDKDSKSLIRYYDANGYKVSNCYYLNTQGVSEGTGLPATEEMFKNGSVALALREGANGSIWGQNVGTDDYPNFSGKLENSLAETYKVTFHTFEDDTAAYFGSYIAGFKKNLPATVVKPNTEFRGWYANAEFEGDVVTFIDSTATGDKEFWAKLQRTFKVTLNTNGGTVDSGNVTLYTEGVGAILPTKLSLDTNIFAGWYDNAELSGKPVTTITATDTGDKTYYAAWFKLKMPKLDSTDMCYEITDVAELFGYAAYVSGTHRMFYNISYPGVCGKLTKDIVVNEHVLNEDGTLDSANVTTFLPWETIKKFGGVFDGQGHTISGLYGDAKAGGMALFGEIITDRYDWEQNVYLPAVIKNLTIEDAFLAADKGNVAGFALSLKGKSGSTPAAELVIENCHFKGVAHARNQSASGLVAYSNGTLSITDSHSEGLILARNGAGGMAAETYATTSVLNSYNVAKITGGFDGTGGLIGNASGTTSVMNSFNRGDVSAENVTGSVGICGGLVGQSYNAFTLLRSYNEGTVGGITSYAAGLVGDISSGSDYEVLIANNYNTGKVYSEADGTNQFTYVSGIVVRINSNVNLKLLNNYSIGELSKVSVKGNMDYVLADSGYNKKIVSENNYYLETVEGLAESMFGTAASAEEFEDGSVAELLHAFVQKDGEGAAIENGVNGSAWAQGDKYPILVTKSEFAIVFNVNGGKLENAPTTYKYGEGLVLPVPTRVGHSFHGWYTSASFQGDSIAVISSKDAGDKIFFAKWEANQYHVTAKVNESRWGVVEGLNKSGIYSYGDEVKVTAVPDNGYKFSYWEDDIRNSSASRRFTVVSDTTITAHFEPINPESSSSEESSSSANSSSSEKSSSSSAKSSSSEESSSSAKSSSSECKGKDCKDALPAIASAPMFRVEAVSRMVQVSGAREGAAYALLDLQGRVLASGRVPGASFALPVPTSGLYLVRVGNRTLRVNVK